MPHQAQRPTATAALATSGPRRRRRRAARRRGAHGHPKVAGGHRGVAHRGGEIPHAAMRGQRPLYAQRRRRPAALPRAVGRAVHAAARQMQGGVNQSGVASSPGRRSVLRRPKPEHGPPRQNVRTGQGQPAATPNFRCVCVGVSSPQVSELGTHQADIESRDEFLSCGPCRCRQAVALRARRHAAMAARRYLLAALRAIARFACCGTAVYRSVTEFEVQVEVCDGLVFHIERRSMRSP